MILPRLAPLLDPAFSPSSYGFSGRVNHDILRVRLARRIGDQRLPRIGRRFLQAGLMQHGVCVARAEGTPPGGPLSP